MANQVNEPRPNSLPAYLTTGQAAELLSVDAGKVLDWIHAGELTAVNVATVRGGRPRWRIRPDALEQFLLRRQSQSAPTSRRRSRKPAEVTQFY